MPVLLVLLAMFILIAPVLAIAAYVRVRRLERERRPLLPEGLWKSLSDLEARLSKLESKLAASPAVAAEPQPAPPPTPTPVAPTTAPPSPPIPPPPPPVRVSAPLPPSVAPTPQSASSGLDLESLIAGRWLHIVGLLALLLATAFFLKYAFENNWIGPTGRVALGLLSGVGLLVWSQHLLRRGHLYFSEGIAGLGAGVLYLSLYAGWSFYNLFPQAVAFAAMIAVTAALLAIAVGRDSLRLAFIALTGGFLTPALVSTGTDQQVILFSYVAVLDAGLLALARARNWRSLELVSFFATQVYFWGWYFEFYDPSKLGRTALFATLFFVLFAALPVLRSRRWVKLQQDQIALVLFNAFLFLVALRAMLWPERRWTLTLAVLALAAGHLVVARRAPPFEEGARVPPLVQQLFAGLALTFVTLAIPIRLEGKWITMAWAVEGAALVWSGFQLRERLLRAAGLLLFGVVAFRLWFFPVELGAGRFLLNARFAAFAVAVGCFAAGAYWARQRADELESGEGGFFAALGVGVNVFLLWALSLEVWDLFGGMRATAGLEPRLARQLALSLLWTLYASGLIVAGIRQKLAGLRWQALALFGLVVGKVFLFDLSFLDRFYRIVSFLVLGAVLLAVSFLYQKRLAAAGSSEAER